MYKNYKFSYLIIVQCTSTYTIHMYNIYIRHVLSFAVYDFTLYSPFLSKFFFTFFQTAWPKLALPACLCVFMSIFGEER